MKIQKLIAKIVLIVFMTCGTIASATVINFDNVPDGTALDSYAGFTWVNFFVAAGSDYPGTGIQNGTVSQPNVAVNGFGFPSIMSNSAPFTLNSARITAAYNDGVSVQAVAFNGYNVVYDNSYTVNSSGPSLVNFDFVDVTMIMFITTFNGNLGPDSQVAMDDIVVNEAITPVPEPATIISGVAMVLPFGVGAVRRLRKELKKS